MPLPILKVIREPSTEMLVRYFHQAHARWTQHLAEDTQLDFGRAWTNPLLPRVHVANRMMDVALPAGMSPADALQQAEAHFAEQGVRCWQWMMNPSAPAEQTQPMADHLSSLGYGIDATAIMRLSRAPIVAIAPGSRGLKIIPARASFRHARQIYELSSRQWGEPQLVDAAMMHLDDPHYDALIALHDGIAVGHIGVLAVGEIGLIEDVFVAGSFRGRGVGKTLMSRATEICSRSLSKHVLVGVTATDAIAIRLYESCGFRTIGQATAYHRPPA